MLMLTVIFPGGCGSSARDTSATGKQPVHATGTSAAATESSSTAGHSGGDHSEWWCQEHGVPEKVCGQCNSKLAAEFQKKGDWCRDHDRPQSQCFRCDPPLQKKFAAQYEAKYGKQPPMPEG